MAYEQRDARWIEKMANPVARWLICGGPHPKCEPFAVQDARQWLKENLVFDAEGELTAFGEECRAAIKAGYAAAEKIQLENLRKRTGG